MVLLNRLMKTKCFYVTEEYRAVKSLTTVRCLWERGFKESPQTQPLRFWYMYHLPMLVYLLNLNWFQCVIKCEWKIIIKKNISWYVWATERVYCLNEVEERKSFRLRKFYTNHTIDNIVLTLYMYSYFYYYRPYFIIQYHNFGRVANPF